MKTIRNIILTLSMAVVLHVSAQLPYDQYALTFRSTSTMTSVGSVYSANPSLNADGTAAYNSPSYSHEKAPEIRKGPPGPTTGDKDNPDIEGPIGDAVIPLLLIAVGYIVYRRRKHLAN